MKRLLSIVLAASLILTAVMPIFAAGFAPAFEMEGAEPEENDGQPDRSSKGASSGSADTWLKVGLLYGSSAPSEVTLKSDNGFLVADVTKKGWSESVDLREFTVLKAVRVGGGIVLQSEDGEILADGMGSGKAVVSAAKGADSRKVNTGKGTYRDGVILLPDGEGISVINYVTLEHYLWGVLANEMGTSYPEEALKAQAVTARSYAVCNLGKHKSRGFDLCSSTDCQVYRGTSSEYAKTTNACKATAGLVISYNGKAACGYYFSHSGGYTLDCADVWGSDSPYLKGVKDEFVEKSVWNTSITFKELRTKMTASGYDVGEIQSVEVSALTDNGGVAQILVHSSKGDHTVSRENLRLVFGSSVIKSQFFSMGSEPEPGIGRDGTQELCVQSESGRAEALSVCVLSADGTAAVLDAADLTLCSSSGTGAFVPGADGWYVYSHEAVDSGPLYFTGMGTGHGVGMPQTSAGNMAEAGYGFEEILHYYYTDIEVADYRQL